MKRAVLVFVLAAGTVAAQPVDTLHYAVFTAAGDSASLGDIVAAMRSADVVFLGETHDDSTAHVLQRNLLEAADSLGRPLALGLEMFERDVQLVLDEYLAGLTRERDMLAATRPWSNYVADYRPLVEYAREHSLPVLATNAPGRYVNRVSRLGSDSLAALSDAAKTTLPPLPIIPASDTLSAKFGALMKEMMGHGAPPPDSTVADSAATTSPHLGTHHAMPTMENMLAAQNLRDAAMAWTLAEHLDTHSDALVIHVNGSFHSDGGLGIPEHLARYRPGTRTLIVTMKPDTEDATLAGNDFVIYTGGREVPD